MDSTNRSIIDILEEHGRASFTEIAKEIGVSEGTVRNRVESMKQEGVIEGFTVQVSEKSSVQAFVLVELESGADPDSVYSKIESFEIYELAGPYDAIIRLGAESSREINQMIDDIRDVEGVRSTETYMVLNER